MSGNLTRRSLLSTTAALSLPGGARSASGTGHVEAEIRVDPTPKHQLSPYLYMQFMEPLGATDGSVEAAWDHVQDRWRPDVIRATQELAPSMMRWGGIFTDYYRWREGVGPRSQRKPMTNLLWGGIESNQIGTAEFVEFCHRVKADPLICVNFESDGRERYMRAREGVRTGNAEEAAEWVAYCNQPDHPERMGHGASEPYAIRHWQIGNETSYDARGFDLETAAKKTREFAEAMKRADESIELIAWGDNEWGPRMMEVAGEYIDYLAVHHMFDPDRRSNPVLRDLQYREDPDLTWEVLMEAVEQHERKIVGARQMLDGFDVPLALTECHFAIPGRDRCDVMSTWATGVAYARMLNLHQRHGDVLKIATAADFCGNRWQVNAVMIPTPAFRGDAFLMPVARVMRLYRQHGGEEFVSVSSSPENLDVTASRTGDKVYLHVANIHRTQAVRAGFELGELTPKSATAFEIAVATDAEITRFRRDLLNPQEKRVALDGPWEFPPASVTAVELDCSAAT